MTFISLILRFGLEMTLGYRFDGYGNQLSRSTSNFEGPIPSFLFQNCSLSSIDFTGNSLNGTIPAKWKSRTINRFLISKNRFSGALPPTFASQLSWSAEFSVAYNNLSGFIPKEYYTSYRSFDISGNDFDVCATASLGLSKHRFSPRESCVIYPQVKSMCSCTGTEWPFSCDIFSGCPEAPS